MGFKTIFQNRKNNGSDYQLTRELNLSLDSEYKYYQREQALKKNYAHKINKNKFYFGKAQLGVKNLIVTPYAREYQKNFGIKIDNKTRDAVARSRTRTLFRQINRGE